MGHGAAKGGQAQAEEDKEDFAHGAAVGGAVGHGGSLSHGGLWGILRAAAG